MVQLEHPPRPRIAGFPLLLLAAAVFLAAPKTGARASIFGGAYRSAAGDTLAMPGEVFVLTAGELASLDINTIEDIIDFLPGVYILQDGPPGSATLFSVDGRTFGGLTLLVNGLPYDDPYDEDPLARFLTLSRVRRVEVIYSSSPTLTGRAESAGVINIVVEEGGRKPPFAAGDFTWGANGRKSRKAWFSTPDAFINGTITYDDYMQESMELVVDDPAALVGEYDSRSVSMELTLKGRSAGRMLARLRRYEDSYTGTRYWPDLRDPLRPPESVRYSGFDSEIRYLRGGVEVSLRQRMVEMKRKAGITSGLVFGGAVSWHGFAGSTAVKGFVSAERSMYENNLRGNPFSPDIDRAEAGVTLGAAAGPFRWRGALAVGTMTASGFYAGGEAAVSTGSERGFYQTLMVARRVRTPTCEELFQPAMEALPSGYPLATEGDADLVAERSDEVSLGLGYGEFVRTDFFARFERNRIVLEGSDPAAYASAGEDDVVGLRASLAGGGATGILSIDYRWTLSGSWFADEAALTPGIPVYRIRGGLKLSRRSFGKSETVTLGIYASDTGSRRFGDVELGRYALLDLSLSITVIGAVVKFEMKNALDEKYETAPGLYMPGVNYRFGINWRLFD